MTDSVSPLPAASSSPQFSEKGKPQSTFDRPTLGQVIRLGELFDERRNKFLGVQLYKEEAIRNNIVITDIKHTDLTLSQSNSVQDKSDVLDINANLSLDVFGGLVPIRGSASYLRSPPTNSQKRSWAMALKMRTEKHRLLFAGLDSKVVEEVKAYYVPAATHFVSAIIYGGNIVINMTERSRDLTENDIGKKLNQLKGAISLEGRAVADVKGEFNALDNKFDLVVYGDIVLDKNPSSAKDVLDIIPNAVGDLIHGSRHGADGSAAGANNLASNTEVHYRTKGIPVFVTLQPIPTKLRKDDQIDLDVFRLKPSVVDEILSISSKLDDLRNRFTTLVDETTTHREFIPKLADRVQASANAFYEEHRRHLRSLGRFLEDIQHGDEKKTEVNNFESSSYPKAKKLYTTHTTATGTKEVHTHEFPLICLERSFRDFQDFVYDISLEPSGLEDQHGNELPSRLSTIDDVRRALRHQSIVPLFLMTPSLDHDDADFAVIRFLTLLRSHKTFHPRYLVYLEDTSDVEVLPHAKEFQSLDGPAYFLGKVNGDWDLMWTRNGKDKPDSLGLGDFIRKATNRLLRCLT